MSKSKVPIIKIQVNTAGIENGIDTMAASLEGLSGSIGDSFSGLLEILHTISADIVCILEEMKEIDWLGVADTGIQALSTIWSKDRPNNTAGSGGYVGKYEARKTGESDKASASGDMTDHMGIAFSNLGDLAFLGSDEDLLQSLGNLIAKLKESAAAWAAQMGAKIADKAVDLQIIALYAVDYIKAFGAAVAQLAASTAAWVANTAAKVASTAAEWAQIAATTAWNALCAVATTVTTAFGAAMAFLTSPIGLVVAAIAALIAIVVLLVKNWDTVKSAVLGAWEAIKDALGNAWAWFRDTVADPVVNGFKGMINGVIGFINGMIAGIVQGINGVIGVLNKLRFAVPDWIPGIGGKTLGFHLNPVTAPQIPYLAQGAVLPANKPFMAVVGDQRHGTNIEAPLTTIQEAVRMELGDLAAAMHAGLEALLAENRQLRRTVEAIEVGDTVIGQAAARYSHRQAVMSGGAI